MSVQKFESNVRKAAHYLGLLLASAAGDTDADNAVAILAGTGAPSGATYGGQTLDASQKAIAIRKDATSADAFMFFTLNGGTAWTAVDAGSPDLDLLSAAVVDVANDSFALIDADDSNASKKDAIADLIAAIAGAGLTATSGVLAANASLLPMAVFGPWAVDGDGAETNGAGLVGTEPQLALGTVAKVYDAANVEYNDLATSSGGTDYTSNYQLLTDTKNDGDYVAFLVSGPEIAFDMSATVMTYTGDGGKWQYSKGGGVWGDLTVYDGTDSTAGDGLRAFQRDGAVSFVLPADFAEDTIDGETGKFVRWIVVTNGNIGTVGLTNSELHQSVTPLEPWTAPFAGTVVAVAAASGAATLGSTADTKFELVNFTTGLGSGELTWTKATRAGSWSGLSLVVSAADQLGVIVHQEDGVAEHDNVLFHLAVTPS
jgi:hypothetical protein